MKFSIVKLLTIMAVLLTIGALVASAGERRGFFKRTATAPLRLGARLATAPMRVLSGPARAGCHGVTAVSAGCYGSVPSAAPAVFVPVPYPVGAPRPVPPVRWK